MQGQRSAIGSLPDSINFDYGSPTSNVCVDRQFSWNNHRNPAEGRMSDSSSSDTFMGGISQEGPNFSRWSVGESSSSNPWNIVSYDERMAECGWPASVNGSVGAGSRLEDQRYEPTNFVSHSGVNLNLISNPVVARPSSVRRSVAEFASHNHDSDDSNFRKVSDDMNFHNSSYSIDFENRFRVSASSSSDLSASSGSGGFLVEEDEGRPDCSVDDRRPSCKRKTLEANVGQSSSGGSCFPKAMEGGMWHAGPPCCDANGNASISLDSSSFCPTEQVNPRIGLGLDGISADSVCSVNLPGGPDTSQRSYLMGVNPSMQQNSVPDNSLSPARSGARRPDSLTAHPPLRFPTMNPPLDLMSPIPSDSSVPQSQPVMLRVPAPRRNAQASRGNGAVNLRHGSSSSSTVSGVRDAILPEDLNSRNSSRNVTEHPMFPPVETRNSARASTHRSVSSGNVGVSRHHSSNSRSGSASAEPGPSWAPHRRSSSQYSRRLEYVRRSLLSAIGSEHAVQGSNSQLLSSPVSSQEGIPTSSGNQGHNQSHARSALWIERQGDSSVGMPYSLRALVAAGEGRNRLVSELNNVLDMMRRGEGLHFEDVMVLDQSLLFGMADVHDRHRDMRLDVDNMSYEELLTLEERIGNVCTGLSEDTILNRLKQRKYIHKMTDEQIDTEPCCICQEEYSDGEGIGTLDCGHDFHSQCIKQWLAHKNLCPICKTTALAT